MKTVDELIAVGEGFLDSGRYKEAIEYFQKAIDIQPVSKAYELKALAQYTMLDAEHAITNFTQAIYLDPENHNAYFNRGMIFMEKEDLEMAKADFKRAYDLLPENLSYRINLAYIYFRLKEEETCLELCDKILAEDSYNFHALLYKASILSDWKQYREAIKLFDLLRQIEPEDAVIYNALGFCYIYTHELQKAKNNFELAMKLNPEYAYPWDNLGYVYYLEKNYEEALKLIDHSIALDASNSWAFKNRALVYMATGRMQEAEADLHYALELGYAKDYDDEVDYFLKTYFPAV